MGIIDWYWHLVDFIIFFFFFFVIRKLIVGRVDAKAVALPA